MNTSPPTEPTAPTDQDLIDLGVRFLSAILDSASVEKIGRNSWWDRARTALETGTSTTSFSEATAKAAAKLQIDGALSARSAEEVNRLAKTLTDPGVFGRWAELMRRDAVYITALTQIARKARPKAAVAAATREEAGF